MKLVAAPELLFFNAVRLIVDGRSSGTAFFVAYQMRKREVAPLFLVTAKHVIENARNVLAYFQAGKTEPALTTPIEVALPDRWYFHPDRRVDVAVLSSEHFEQDLKHSEHDAFLFAIPTDDFVAQWLPTPHPIFELLRIPQSVTEVVFVGYPNNYFDPATGLPVMRRGLTATPLWLDYDGEPAFLIDAAVVKGSSGSPVFHIDWHNPDLARRVARLVGIVAETVLPKQVGRRNAETDETRHIHLGRVYKAHTIITTIEAYLETGDA